jgi:hypothetical protein
MSRTIPDETIAVIELFALALVIDSISLSPP